MAIVDQKREIFGSIGALNVLNDGFPKLPNFDSFGSVNNGTDSTQFLIDLLQSLVGFEALKEHIINTITYQLENIEDAIKDGLKAELKEMVSCSINPSIPTWFQTGGVGVEIPVSKIDFFDMMKINPDTTEGKLFYTDIQAQKNSKDYNTYLNYKIQDPTSTEAWGQATLGNDIMTSVFNEQGTNENNTVTFTTDYGVAGGVAPNAKLPDFNNDFIDSLTIFGEPGSLNSITMINLIIEELFGSISATKSVGKSKKQLRKEAELREVLDCIINSEEEIDDSFFTFDNPTLAEIGRQVENRSRGIMELETCGNLAVQIDVELATTINDDLNQTTNKAEEAQKVAESLDKIADAQAGFTPNNKDKVTVRGNFFVELIRKFTRIIMNLIISPKFLALFIINHQIIYGQGTSYADALDFIKKNKKLIKNIVKIIRNILLNLLLTLALKYLTIKLSQKFAGDEIEKGKNYISIILSYLGVPPEVLAMIRGL